jgi:putative flavoprotein involved in K+ transport
MTSATADQAALDVLVIGAGQAGLAMGHELRRLGCRFQIVDAGHEIGHVWRSRWDSLRLFTSGRHDSLPGLPFPAAPDAYPGKDDVADYLQAYATTFSLPVRLDTTATSLSSADGIYVMRSSQETIQARQVVLATGPFHAPFTPAVSAQIDAAVHQIHSVDYRRPEDVPAGRVLVVGAANTGCQIALELSATHRVGLSVGQRLPTIPQRPLGHDIWSWATALRLDHVTADSPLGRRLSGRDQIIGTGPRGLARRHGVRLRPRVTDASRRVLTFSDGDTAQYDTVVWATGFTPDNGWIDIPGVIDERGAVRQSRGVTPSRGLYTLGLSWQHTRGSALLGWVGDDAALLATEIESTAS